MMKVLIVDDEYLVRELLKRSVDFKSIGFEIVAEASDGAEALELVKENRVDLVIADINMPVMDGITLCEEIKKHDSTINTIILTGYADLDFAIKSIHIGVSDFLLKPINVTEVQEALLKLIDTTTNEVETKSKLIQQVINWLAGNLENKNLSLQLAADYFFVNNCHLSRKFKKEMNDTFKNYLIRLRISKAKELLDTTELKNYEIAEKIGIANPNYFSYYFKRTMNISITEYKNRYKGQENKDYGQKIVF